MRFFFLLLVSVCYGQVPVHTQHYPNNHMSSLDYTIGEPYSLVPYLQTWLRQRFDLVIGSGTVVMNGVCNPWCFDAHGPQTYWAAYTDGLSGEAGQSETPMYLIRQTATNHGWDFEKMVFHTSVDMTGNGPTLNNKFDSFDTSGNGALLYSGSTFTDVTSQTYYGGGTTVASTLYLGYMVPFDQFIVSLTTARVSGSVTYKYWNGTSWAALSNHFVDGTSAFTTSGTVSWYPPSDWTMTALNSGTNAKYWVQVVVTGAGTSPVYSTIKAVDWSTIAAGNATAGWSSTDSNRINVGTPIEYNPTPPSGQSAHFPYQSRIPRNTTGALFGNVSNVQGGLRAWATFLVDQTATQISGSTNYDSQYWDDAAQNTCPLPLCAANYTNYDINTTGCASGTACWFREYALNMAQTVADGKTRWGSNFATFANSDQPGNQDTSNHLMPNNFLEYSTGPIYGAYVNYTSTYDPTNPPWAPYDSSLPTPNPNGNLYYFMCNDPWTIPPLSIPPFWTSYHYYDHGNRGPIGCLAMDAIGHTSLSGFGYVGGANTPNGYQDVDEVFVYQTPTTITTALNQDLTGSVQTVKLASTSPCLSTYNTGSYVQIGGNTSQDVLIGKIGQVWYLHANGNYYEETANLRNGYAPQLFNSGNNGFVMGDSNKYSSAYFTFSQTLTSGSVVWTYWNGTTWSPLTVTDGTSNFTTNGTVTWTPPSDWATKAIIGDSGTVTAYYVRAQESGDIGTLLAYSSEWVTLTTEVQKVYNNYSIGATATCFNAVHLSISPAPAASHVYAWTRWFTAMGTDLGTPTGARQIPWKTGGPPDNTSNLTCTSTDCSDTWRRDFTKCIVLWREWRQGVTQEAEFDTYSKSLSLGGTYYPLYADGSTGSGITSIQLRGAEGAILMSNPITATNSVSTQGQVKFSGQVTVQ